MADRAGEFEECLTSNGAKRCDKGCPGKGRHCPLDTKAEVGNADRFRTTKQMRTWCQSGAEWTPNDAKRLPVDAKWRQQLLKMVFRKMVGTADWT